MHLESYELSVAEFAKRCDLPAEFVQEIISGEAPLDRETVLLFEREFGSKAYNWLGIDVEYQQSWRAMVTPQVIPFPSSKQFGAVRNCSGQNVFRSFRIRIEIGRIGFFVHF